MRIGDWISMKHLDRMTDSTGLIQHAIYNIPRRESGYTTDDNARALRLCARLWQQRPDERMLNRVMSYLSFLEFAHCPGGGFHNFLSYQRGWLDAVGCGDCQGQAVRALAEVLGSALPEGCRLLARELIEAVLPALADLRSLRAQAYVILAWGHLWAAGVKNMEPLESVAWSAAKRLEENYRRSSRPDWMWFESRMTYANAVLPHALFVAARRWPNEEFLNIAKTTFAFLDHATTAMVGGQRSASRDTPGPLSAVYWPVGNSGWLPHGGDKAPYDQQPVEAAMMADAALTAFGALNDSSYLVIFRRAHGWFQGLNSLNLPLADPQTGSCHDGLHPTGANRNQGAESTLAFLWTESHNLELQRSLSDNPTVAAVGA